MLKTLKNYYELTKPRLIYGNLITVIGGVFLGSHGHPGFFQVLAACAGIGLIMASGCVINNIYDRDIDALMERTKTRSTVSGAVDLRKAGYFALGLFIAGLCMLISNGMSAALYAVIGGFVAYVFVYTMWLKRTSIHGTLVGAIAGATPPLAGYLAAHPHFDANALGLFFALLFWQMPHAFAIAMYRSRDYAAAKIPVLPLLRSKRTVRRQMLLYAMLFGLSVLVPYITGSADPLFAIIPISLTARWIYIIGSLSYKDETVAGKKIFRFSLLVIIGTFLTLIVAAK